MEGKFLIASFLHMRQLIFFFVGTQLIFVTTGHLEVLLL